MDICEGLSRMSWKLSRTVLRGGVTGNGGTLLGLPISGQKIPVFVTQPDESPLAFAGLWDVWHDKQNPETVYRSCTIITRDSSDCLRKVHDRMPAVLHPDTYAAWLDPDNRDVAQLHNLLSNQTRTEFVFRPVSKQVNSVHFNDPVNIRPIQTEFVF
jgi:putative SOS response-associated peptidase YedK